MVAAGMPVMPSAHSGRERLHAVGEQVERGRDRRAVGQREGAEQRRVGALDVIAHGLVREAIDVLLAPEGLRRLKAEVLGRGYVEKFPGSRGLRDVETGVDIDVVLAGEFPGDGRPKAVAFPDPTEAAVPGHRVALVSLKTLVELKLASGISAPHRLRDLADVLELIRALSLPRDLSQSLDPSVRAKYEELWQAAQTADRE